MVITDVNKVIYNGDGVVTAWPYTFRIINRTDIRLMLIDTDGTSHDIESDYYVDMVNSTVYYPGYAAGSEPPEEDQPPKVQPGQKIVVYRKLPINQLADLGDKWPFALIELGLDKLTMILQDIWDWLGRCLSVSLDDSINAGDDFDPTVPLAADKVVCGNADGTGFDAREAMMEVNGHWDGEGRQIKGVAEPTDNQDAATKHFVEGYGDNNFMKLQPDGTAWEARNLPISNVGGPALVKDAATKDYVDRILEGYSGQGERFKLFDNVAQMKVADLIPSQVVETLGYTDIDDDGAGVYAIRAAISGEQYDGHNLILLDNGYVAEYISVGEAMRQEHDNIVSFREVDILRPTQDAVVYDGKMFYSDTDSGVLTITDFETGTVLASNTLDGGAKPHCNTICFGKKQNDSDTYPLLYITGYNGQDEYGNDLPPGTCFVYKINDDLTNTFVQEIIIGFTNDDLWNSGYNSNLNTGNTTMPYVAGAVSWGNFIVDYDNDKLYVAIVTRYFPVSKVFEFDLPETSSSSVTLTTDDITNIITLPRYKWLQGSCYYNGNLYLSYGTFNVLTSVYNPCGISIINLKEHTQIGYIAHRNYFKEIEAVFVYKDELYVGGPQNAKFFIADGYKKVGNIGDIRSLQTRRNDNLVDAINSANLTSVVVEGSNPLFDQDISMIVLQCVLHVKSNSNSSDGFLLIVVNSLSNIGEELERRASEYVESTRYMLFEGLLHSNDMTGSLYEFSGNCNLKTKDICVSAWKTNDKSNIINILGNYESQTVTKISVENGIITEALVNEQYEIEGYSVELYPGRTYHIKGDGYASYMINGVYSTNNVLTQIITQGTGNPIINDMGTATGRFTATATDNGEFDVYVDLYTVCNMVGNKKFSVIRKVNEP